MNIGVKTTISTNRHIYDQKGTYLPSGNYYFLIKQITDNMAIGDITCKGDFGEFTFECSKVIKMMAIAQARLARRANLQEEGIPTYSSPINSPSHSFYNTNNIVQNYESLPTVNYKNRELTLPTTYGNKNNNNNKKMVIKELQKCVICLNSIKNNKKNLVCFHSFHCSCINEWFRDGNYKCPICRKEQPFEVIYDVSDNLTDNNEEENTNEENTNEENTNEENTNMNTNRIIRVSNRLPYRVRINNFVSDNSSRTNNLERLAINNIRSRYTYRSNRTSHRYNLRPRTEI